MACPECEVAKQHPNSGLYQFKCQACRERLIEKEGCKDARDMLISRLRRWGENKPSSVGICKCQSGCYRKRVANAQG